MDVAAWDRSDSSGTETWFIESDMCGFVDCRSGVALICRQLGRLAGSGYS